MIKSLRTSSGKGFLICLVFLLATGLSILLDIPILRQVLGFLFVILLPGFLILHILKLGKLGLTEKIVLSMGLSTSFLMFVGLLMNWVYPLLGYSKPLSTVSLVVSLTVILLILAIFAYLRNRTVSFIDLSDFKLNAREKAFLLLPAFFPLLSILGMHLMNTSNNNIILMTLLLSIPAYTILIAIKHRRVPEKIYPPVIFLISISLLLMLLLRGHYIMGADIHSEYYLFRLATSNQYWQITGGAPLGACLSISLLPVIHQSFLNIAPEYLFQILHYSLLAICPLVIYLFSRKYIGNFWSFLAALFFISQPRFLTIGGGLRTDIAILFFVLSIMVLFHSELSKFNKRVFFITFTASCIASHYASTYIFFLVLLLTWVGMQIIPRVLSPRRKLGLSPNPFGSDSPNKGSGLSLKNQNATLEASYPRLKSNITINGLMLFFVLLFFWYSQVTGPSFAAGVRYFHLTLGQLQEFFVLESRVGTAEVYGAGLALKDTLGHISFVISWLVIIFIGIGVLSSLARYRYMVTFSDKEEGQSPQFLSHKLDGEFFIMSLVCSAILVVVVALPYALHGYNLNRVYFQMVIILSPFFVIGGIVIARFSRTKWAYLAVLAVLIPYFLFQTGTMHQMFGNPLVMTLNSEGDQYNILFVHDQESYAAKWLRDNGEVGDIKVYTDSVGGNRLISQGNFPPRLINQRDELLSKDKEVTGYVYLRYHNIVNGKLRDTRNREHNIAEYQDNFAYKNKIYDNGGSEIWR